jgi:hypothetical protein
MFKRSSLKLGLDRAVLTSMGEGGESEQKRQRAAR